VDAVVIKRKTCDHYIGRLLGIPANQGYGREKWRRACTKPMGIESFQCQQWEMSRWMDVSGELYSYGC
jgi:hypothetical protein